MVLLGDGRLEVDAPARTAVVRIGRADDARGWMNRDDRSVDDDRRGEPRDSLETPGTLALTVSPSIHQRDRPSPSPRPVPSSCRDRRRSHPPIRRTGRATCRPGRPPSRRTPSARSRGRTRRGCPAWDPPRLDVEDEQAVGVLAVDGSVGDDWRAPARGAGRAFHATLTLSRGSDASGTYRVRPGSRPYIRQSSPVRRAWVDRETRMPVQNRDSQLSGPRRQ